MISFNVIYVKNIIVIIVMINWKITNARFVDNMAKCLFNNKINKLLEFLFNNKIKILL